jgi:hypothetical protein
MSLAAERDQDVLGEGALSTSTGSSMLVARIIAAVKDARRMPIKSVS